MLETLFDGNLSSELQWLLVFSAKATVVLLFSVGVVFILRKWSPATKSSLWLAGFVGILILPAFSFVLPNLSILPALDAPTIERTLIQEPVAISDPEASSLPREVVLDQTSVSAGPVTDALVSSWYSLASIPLSVLLFSAWLAGFVLVLLHMLSGMIAVRLLANRASPIVDGTWTDLSEELGDRLFITRSIRLLQSPDCTSPMTWGGWNPVVMLPENSVQWSDEKKRCVLTHEYAHIKRWDTVSQTLSRVVCAVQWFNPLVWFAAKKYRAEREFACDQYVIESGLPATGYAQYLLDIALTFKSTLTRPYGALTMARPSQLEGRVLTVLNSDFSSAPKPKGGPRPIVLWSSMIVVIGLIAAVSPQTRDASLETPESLAGLEMNSNLEQEQENSGKTAAISPGSSRGSRDSHLEENSDDIDTRMRLARAFVNALEDKNASVRERAARILGDTRADEATAQLAYMLEHDESSHVRETAAWALGRIGGDRAFSALLASYESEGDADVREEVFYALREFDAEKGFTEIGPNTGIPQRGYSSKTYRNNSRDRTSADLELDASTFDDLVTELAEIGVRVAEDTVEELSRSLNNYDWDDLGKRLERITSDALSEIDWTELSDQTEDQMSDLSDEVEKLVVDELEDIASKYRGTEKAEQAEEALSAMDSRRARRALRRLSRYH